MALLLLRASLVLLMAFSSSCTHTCETNGQNGDVRLVGGLAPSEGIVEICLNSQWGTVCNNSWDDYDARVVCQQLGFPTANYPYSGERNGSGPIHLDDVHCSYYWYYRLADCPYSTSTSDCSHSDDVGVHCNATPGAPENVTASDVHSRSLTLSWQPPNETYGIDIQQYNVVCATQVYRSSTELSVYVNGLQPYTNYNCCVSAMNIAGDEGLSECTAVMTNESAPSAAPQNIGGDASGSTSLYLYWSPPPLQHRNGLIRRYHIYVREVDTGTEIQRTSTGLQTSTTIYQLHPYYTYECRVAAYTISEGTLSQPVTITTDEDTPSAAPQNILGYASGSTSIFLYWSSPPLQHHNGRIRGYYIHVREVDTGTEIQRTSTGLQTTIYQLHPYYTYEYRVAAYTISEGPLSRSFTITTHQDVPSAPPDNVTAIEVSTTSVHLNWIPPPTEHHNGAITGYVARVTMANTQESYNISTSNTTELSVDSLTPDSEYVFAVAAQTVIGIGPFSGAITQQTKPTPINIATVVGSVIASLAILTALLIATVVGYIGCRKLRKKQLRRSNDINTQGHVYNEIEILELRQQKPGKAIHVKPQQHVNTDIDAQGHVYDDTLERKPGRAIHVKPHQRVQSVPQSKEVKGEKKPRFALRKLFSRRDQRTTLDDSTDVTDTGSKLQSLTFCVSEHVRTFLEQAENSQTLNAAKNTASFNEHKQPVHIDSSSKQQSFTFCVSNHVHTFLEQAENPQTLNTEDTASFSEDEQPPPIPERLYLEQDDTSCGPNLYADQQGVTRLQHVFVQKRGKMNSPASDHIHVCQSRRQREREYEVSQSDAQRQDKEQPIVAENESKQMTSPASDRVYQPLLPRSQRKPEHEVTQSDAKCQDDEQSITAESNSKQTKGPASDRMIYQSSLIRGKRKPAKCQDREQPTAGENKSKQMNSPASDRIYQPLRPRRTAQQENGEYQSLRLKN